MKGGTLMAIEKITRIDTTLTATVSVQKTPAQHKTLQNEITSKQQNLKKIASDADMTATEKEQKRREIQKEIDELNRKLREEQEKAKEEAVKEAKQQAKEEAIKKEELQKQLNPSEQNTVQIINPSNEEEKHVDMSVKDIQQMLSVESVVQKEMVNKQVDIAKESTIQVLKSEIRQDKLYGADTSQKEAELKALQEKENFWTKENIKIQEKQQKEISTQIQENISTSINTNAKVIIDQI